MIPSSARGLDMPDASPSNVNEQIKPSVIVRTMPDVSISMIKIPV